MTGFRSAPIDVETLTQFNNNKISFQQLSINKIKIKNITLFSPYDFTPNPGTILSGVGSIYDSSYSGDLYSKVTGIGEFIDIGSTNSSGIYSASGYHTGVFVDEQNFYDTYGRPVTPINTNFSIGSSDNVKYILSGIFTGLQIKNDYSPLDAQLSVVSFSGNSPIVYRENSYIGVYSGISQIKDNFYNENTNTVSFFKNFFYTVYGATQWNTNFNVVNNQSNGLGETIGMAILNKILNDGSGYADEIRNIIASGNIPKVRLPRNNLTGRAVLTGFLTGRVSPENFGVDGVGSGFKDFLKLITGSGINAKQDYATGFLNAYNYLNYNTPVESDSINIEDDVTDNFYTLTYSTEPLLTAPLYFNSIQTLNNIINSGSGSYGLYSQIIGAQLKLTSAYSGESGNLIQINTFGSATTPTLQNGNRLVSGETYYESLISTGVFSSFVEATVLATGLMTKNYSDYTTGNMTGTLGIKTFANTWDLYLSENGLSYAYASQMTGKTTPTTVNYTTNYIDEATINSYIIKLVYKNPNPRIYDDIVALKIRINNNQQIVMNITGVEQ